MFKNEMDFMAEWAVWAHLESETDLKGILLKGHLLLDGILETVLKRNNILDSENYSFYRKIIALEKIDVNDNLKKDIIISSLKALNKLRNKIAHEIFFRIEDGELDLLALNVLNNLTGTKYTKYTSKTKIVHSFSILSVNLLDLTN